MAALNKILLIGNMVADPELKQTANGTAVTTFRVAVSRRFTKPGEAPQADFFEVVCWRQQAEFVSRYFTKGKPIFICGAMHCRTWLDTNGQKRYSWEVVADEVSFVERKSGDMPMSQQSSREAPYQPDVPDYGQQLSNDTFREISSDDELPF